MHLHVKTAGTYVCLRNGIDHNIKENDNLKYEKLNKGHNVTLSFHVSELRHLSSRMWTISREIVNFFRIFNSFLVNIQSTEYVNRLAIAFSRMQST